MHNTSNKKRSGLSYIKSMRLVIFIVTTYLLFSCNKHKQSEKESINPRIERMLFIREFQTIIDTSAVNGSILIYDLNQNLFYSNDFNWAKVGHLPASTFKIPNSIIALETNTVEHDSTLFKWNGEKRAYKSWEQDLTLKDAFHFSCVPCYQDIARNIGAKKMNHYLQKIQYGDMIVNPENIDLFWLEGASIINQFEQIDFLKRFYQSQLSISKRTEVIMKRMMLIEENKTFKLSGKTGLSVRNGHYNGWFVGYVESKDVTYLFATNVEPKDDLSKEAFPKLRKEITLNALGKIDKFIN